MFKKENSNILEKIDKNTLLRLYKKLYDIDVSYLFQEVNAIYYREHVASGIRYFDPAVPADSDFYEKMQKIDWYFQKSKSEYNTVSKYTKNRNILEIGCGYGYFSDHSNADEYTGLEYNQRAIDTVLQRGSAGLKLYKENIEQHAINNSDKYDVVCSFQVLEHVSDPMSFIECALACCKIGGYLIFSVPALDSFLRYGKNNILNMPPHHLSHWPDRAFKYLEKKYEIELVTLKHESLDTIHKQGFLNILGENLIRNIFCLNNRDSLIAQSFFDKVLSKCGRLIGSLLSKGYDNRVFMPIGHTVTAIFRKL